MISLKFGKFMDGNYDDKDECHELYILKKDNQVLYVGISKRDIWDRWFSGWSSHMILNGWGEWFSDSRVGRAVTENMPVSLEWDIEFFTKEDCLKLLGQNIEKCSIEYIEGLIINKLQPSLNIALANYSHGQTDLIDFSHLKAGHRKVYG